MARRKIPLPVPEFDDVGLPTVPVAIKGEYDIEQIVYAVRKGRGDTYNEESGKYDFKLPRIKGRPMSRKYEYALYKDQVEDWSSPREVVHPLG